MSDTYQEMVISSLLGEFCLDRDDYHTITLVEQGAGYPPVMVCQAHEYGIRVICQTGAKHLVLSQQDSSLWYTLLFKLYREVRKVGKTRYLERDSGDIPGVLFTQVIGRDRGNTNDWVFGLKGTDYKDLIQGNLYLDEVAKAMMPPEVWELLEQDE